MTTITIMATSAPVDMSKVLPPLAPEAPASSSGVPLDPAFAVPAVLPSPPVYGSRVASGKEEEVVVAMVVHCLMMQSQTGRDLFRRYKNAYRRICWKWGSERKTGMDGDHDSGSSVLNAGDECCR